MDIRCSHLAANQAQKPRLPKLPKLPVVVHFGRSVAAGVPLRVAPTRAVWGLWVAMAAPPLTNTVGRQRAGSTREIRACTGGDDARQVVTALAMSWLYGADSGGQPGGVDQPVPDPDALTGDGTRWAVTEASSPRGRCRRPSNESLT